MDIVKVLFNMSLRGSLVFLVFLLLRPITKNNFNSSWHYRSSIIILLVFLLPLGNLIQPLRIKNIGLGNVNTSQVLDGGSRKPNDLIGDINKQENPLDIGGQDKIGENLGDVNESKDSEIDGREVFYPGSENSRTFRWIKDMASRIFNGDYLVYIWLTGMIGVFLLKLIPYISFKNLLASHASFLEDGEKQEIFFSTRKELSIKAGLDLKTCKYISSPMLIGILRPSIVIPDTKIDNTSFRMILLHELNHYKRKDILIKAFAFIVNAIHWFNPLIYFLLIDMEKHCEYSIDERVVGDMNMEDRKYYGETILKLVDNSIQRRCDFTTAMGSGGRELKSRLENLIFFKRDSRKRAILSFFSIILILLGGFTVACNIMPSNPIAEVNPLLVCTRDDGLYYHYLKTGEEGRIHKGNEISYPLISRTGAYVAYTSQRDLYIYNFKEAGSEKLVEEVVSYAWTAEDQIIYSTRDKGFTLLDLAYGDRERGKQSLIDDYYYENFTVSQAGHIYANALEKWSQGQDEFAYNRGIVEISLDDSGDFITNTLVEGRKSIDEEIGYDPRVWHISQDSQYLYIMEKPASASLSTDGIGLGIYDLAKKDHTPLEDLTILPYKDNLAINPKDRDLIATIEGEAREMILNKEVVILDLGRDKSYKLIDLMDKNLVAKTPSFSLDGKSLLYSATETIDTSQDFDYNEEFIKWEKKPHYIYEYDLKSKKTSQLTTGEGLDFRPINIDKDTIIFIRYKDQGYFKLIKLENKKEEILADDLTFDSLAEARGASFYGHVNTERAMDIFLGGVERPGDKNNIGGKPAREKAPDSEGGSYDSYKEIRVRFNDEHFYYSDLQPISIKDNKMIGDILSMLEEGQLIKNTSRLDKIRDNACWDNELILTGIHEEKTEIKFTFDDLYNQGFIEKDGTRYEVNYDLFRYLEDLIEYDKYDTNIDKEVLDLFEKYKWTIDYKVNTIKEKLPANLKHGPGEHPIKLYWAYNMALSKSIGLDFSQYLGQTVEVEIYRLREALPQYLHPRLDARGIVIKKDGNIVGAYIDPGRHQAFACSLKRQRLENIVGQEWEDWILDYIDYNDKIEKELAKLEPEELIQLYFDALVDKDIRKAKACLARTKFNVSIDLASNMHNKELYNKSNGDYLTNIRSVELLDIERLDKDNVESETLKYRVNANYKFKKMITHEDGELPYIFFIIKESDKSGWRIENIGF